MAVRSLEKRTFGINGLTFDAAVATNDSAIASGMAFLNGELEKRDPRLLEPLTSVTWPRDIVPKTGGGWSEYTSQYFTDYATTGGNANGIIRGQTNDIPITQANTSKDIWEVFTFANVLKVPFVDQQKLQGIGRNLDTILDDGLRLNWDKSIDYIVYEGIPNENIYGLVNNPSITTGSAPAGASGKTQWANKTPEEILADVNSIVTSTWANSQYDLTGMANHILIPPVQYSNLQQPVTSAGSQSILNYLLDNNIARNQGVDLLIVPCRWVTGAGAGGTDRMVAYVNAENRVNIDMPVPLSRVGTQIDMKEMAYMTAFTGQFSQVKWLYTQPAQYMDGI